MPARPTTQANFAFIVLLMLQAAGTPATAQAQSNNELSLASSTATSTTGAFQLTWSSAGDAPPNFQLKRRALGEGALGGATILYEGTDTARFESGLGDGDYQYAVSIINAQGETLATSASVVVKVSHHPLTRALGFFGLGALVFGAITLWVFRAGTRTHTGHA